MLSFSRVSNLPDDLPDWIRAEASVKRHAAAVGGCGRFLGDNHAAIPWL